FESDKYQQTAANSGNPDPTTYAIGSNLSITPFIHGLVGYWPLNEGSGSTAKDESGWGNDGTGSPIDWTTSGCKTGSCVTAASGYNVINVSSPTFSNLHSNVTITNWIEVTAAIPAGYWPISAGGTTTHNQYGILSYDNGTNWMFGYATDYPTCGGLSYVEPWSANLGLDQWHFLVLTYDGNTVKMYLDGTLAYLASFTTGFCGIRSFYIAGPPASPGSYLVDGVRFYSRALTAAQVMAIYNAENSQ
ncbi:MAG: LamG domain-containing protein, partial [Patescibacteria group bacterium]|nr:LamG domain-containing protein [Patescibacteria group bacterium]